MKINRALSLLLVAALPAGCESARIVPPAPAYRPVPPPQQSTPVTPAPRAAVTADWRDLPQTPGAWRYATDARGSSASFGQPGLEPVIVLRCASERRSVTLFMLGSAATPVPASIMTSSGTTALSANPSVTNGSPNVAIELSARSQTLDAMAFSRGRFAVEVNGLPTLVLPAWAEVGRVIEDCR